MTKTAGIKMEKDRRGNIRYMRVDLKKHGEQFEDFVDNAVCRQRENEETVEYDSFREELLTKHRQKRV